MAKELYRSLIEPGVIKSLTKKLMARQEKPASQTIMVITIYP